MPHILEAARRRLKVIIVPEPLPTRLWTVQDVAQFLSVPRKTLYQWRNRGYGPPARRIGRHLRYDPEDVRSWFAAQSDQPA
ncbi:helix-turn-helix transcriptional regulator [Pseudonocardia lacus]|uniref:helix-turn-helix transcriptional regulator n=1 Tax=Pseudonocardia lacus TaxID=2835865 RepID=UPI001BDC98E9|nr:helix-turn-helix domain-containing protein [Pseudonocardia lacus]